MRLDILQNVRSPVRTGCIGRSLPRTSPKEEHRRSIPSVDPIGRSHRSIISVDLNTPTGSPVDPGCAHSASHKAHGVPVRTLKLSPSLCE